MATGIALIDYQELLRLGLTSPQSLDSLQACHRTDSPFSFTIDFQISNPSDQWKRLVEGWTTNQSTCQVTVFSSYEGNLRSDGSINQEGMDENCHKYLELSELVNAKSSLTPNGISRQQSLHDFIDTLESFPNSFQEGGALDRAPLGSELGNIQLLLRTPSRSKYGWTNLILNVRLVK